MKSEGIDRGQRFDRTSPSKKRDALSAVRTPDETVWGQREHSALRASDIYQGGENEPLPADRDVPAASPSLDNEY